MENDFLERISKLSPKRLALLAMELQERVETLEAEPPSPATEPIAIIGLACRFPGGADSPETFWQLLRDGGDAITEIDASRWNTADLFDPDPEKPGKVATRWGGFLKDVDQFDPQFFGISPREATTMDPQQRLALEIAWEALENAGYAPDKLSGNSTGVFMGICNGDYAQMQMASNRDSLNMYSATGGAHSVVSGRIAYVLGLQGPAISVDTACSSSAVAIHLAVQSLRHGECRMALAGGVNLILSPDTTIALSRAKMMAADGRCKAFDSAADGFVRSEGAGLVMLKRLSEAQAEGDIILAVIRGSALNQDGRSNGLTAPNGPSQEAVMRLALANANVKAEDVGYIETHGTGTSLGDPIEVQALGAVYGPGRAAPFAIGSVKTNLGHTEAAAGVAGLIRVVLSLQHKEIAPHLHLKQLNRYIPWDQIPVTIHTKRTPWPAIHGRRLAGVSSFGFSGTNAHFIVEEAPVQGVPHNDTAAERPLHPLCLSARTPASLRQLAERYQRHLEQHPTESFADVSYTANSRRAHLSQRVGLLAHDAGGAIPLLQAIAAGQTPEGALVGQTPGNRTPEIVFMFTGHGSHYVNMGRQLYETQPIFRAALDRCDQILRPMLGQSLVSVLYPPVDDQPATDAAAIALDSMTLAQPALFAVEYALAELWQAWGIRPTAVMGHSAGEYVAAAVAGLFSLEDSLKLIAARGRLMASLPPNGEMAAVFAPEAQVAAILASWPDQLSIAAINGPESIVISGETNAVQLALAAFEAEGIKSRKLNISMAAHSPLVEPILEAFEQVAATVTFHPPQLQLISGLTGQPADGLTAGNPTYWRRHLRQAVRFADCVHTLHQQGYRLFVEAGPHPTLTGMAQHCLPEGAVTWVTSLRRGQGDWQQVLSGLANLYVHGAEVDWEAFDRGYARHRLPLPTYPFQRERYWFEPTTPDDHRQSAAPAFVPPAEHPLLGRRISSPALPTDQTVYETKINAAWPPFLDHHRIFGMLVLPSPVYIEMALTAAAECFGAGVHTIEDLTVNEALLPPEEGAQTVQFILGPVRDLHAEFRAFSQTDSGKWTLHASGKIRVQPEPLRAEPFSLDVVRARCLTEIDGAVYYERLHSLGLEFGSSFQGLAQIWRRDGEALGRIELPAALESEAKAYHIHPAFLDACFHLLGAPLPDDGTESTYLLIGIERFTLYQTPPTRLWNHTTISESNQETFTGDIRLYDDQGHLIGEALGLQLKRATRQALERVLHRQRHADWLYTVEWQPAPWMSAFAPRQVMEALSPQLAQLGNTHKLEIYASLVPALEALATAYIHQTLDQLGWHHLPSTRWQTGALADQLGIIPQHHRLFTCLLGLLAEDGHVRRDNDGWQLLTALPKAEVAVLREALLQQYGAAAEGEVALMDRCGLALGEVLRGQVNPVSLLFPSGSLASTEWLYQDSPFSRAYNQLTQLALSAGLARWPANRRLRVLEIGAGSGATTASLLPSLPADRTDYIFTDISPRFTSRAQEKFRPYPFVRYQTLDIEQDPLAQGFASQSFDIIIAAHVLHATADLRRTLGHVKQLLVPAGLFLLLESTAHQRWVDMTFGLTEGWWRFRDADLRPDYPLLTPDRWLSLLASLGFSEGVAIPEAGSGLMLSSQALILVAGPTPRSERDCLILADASGLGQRLAQTLQARNLRYRLVEPAEVNTLAWPNGPTDIIDLRSLDLPAEPASAEALDAEGSAACAQALQVAQALVSQRLTDVKLWWVTRNVQPDNGSGVPCAVTPSMLWGLGRVIALEQPEIWGGLVDLDPAATLNENVAALLASLNPADDEDQIAWRGGKPRVARLTPARNIPIQTIAFVPEAAYLITGGLGGLGLKLAAWMAKQGARHLVLLGRTGLPNDSRQTAVQAIEALGAKVTIVAADVANRAQMTELLARFGNDLPPLRGLVHAAAALSHWPILTMPPGALAEMLHPKVTGAWLLHELTREMELDFFMLFSSSTALWGSSQLGHYAAANAFLDALAHYRRASGQTALSINWGIWDEMRLASEADQNLYRQFGLKPMPSDQALEVLGNLLGTTVPQLTVAAVDWNTLKPAYEARRVRPFLALVGSPAPKPETPKPAVLPTEPARPTLLHQLQAARPENRRDLLSAQIREHVAKVLGLDVSQPIDEQQGLFEMGMDSLMSVELKSRLEASTGQALPSTLTFNYPNVAALADFLLLRLAPSAEKPEPPQALPELLVAPTEASDLSEDELAERLMAKLSRLK